MDVQITTKTGTLIRLSGKTIHRNGKRLGYLIADFDYSALMGRYALSWFTLPYTTAPAGKGRRLGQYISGVAEVSIT